MHSSPSAANACSGGDVLAVLVQVDGDLRPLPETLSALLEQSVRPGHVLVVTTEPDDFELIPEDDGDRTLPSLTVAADTTFPDALTAAALHGARELASEPTWIWALHPTTVPAAECLAALLDAARAAPDAEVLQPRAGTSGRHPWEGALVHRNALRSAEPVSVSVPLAQTGAGPAATRPAPSFRDPTLAAGQRQEQADREAAREAERAAAGMGARLRGALVRFSTSPLVLLLAFLVAMTFAVNRARIGTAVSGGALLPAPSGSGTLLYSYLQEWHTVAGGTSSPAAALSGLLGLLALPFGGADHAVAVLLLAAVPLAGISAYCATRAAMLGRGQRAVLAAAWALLPVGASASSYGRLDTVFTYVLLPIVLAGVFSVLRGTPANVDSEGAVTGRSRWLFTTAATALALAALSSASPLMYVLVVLVMLVGFVLLRPAPGTGVRRAAALFFLVLLPVGLLLPWPAVLLAHPEVLAQGAGSTPGPPTFSVFQLVTLGYGAPSAVGVLVAVIAVLMLVIARSARMLAGLAMVVLGVVVAVGVAGVRHARLPDATVVAGNAGPPLVLLAAGLFLVVIVGLQERARRPTTGLVHPRVRLVLPLAVVAVLGVGAVIGGSQGGVRARPPSSLPAALHAELVANRALVLSTAAGDQPARLTSAVLPQLGDDDLVPAPGAARRLAAWSTAITGGDETAAATAVAEAAAAGVGAVVLAAGSGPGSPTSPQLLADAGRTSDGHPVLRVQLPALGARVLEPGLATAARTGGQPPGAMGSPTTAARGTSPVPGGPPQLGVRVSGGAEGRLLVLAAENQAGWDVHVDGTAVAVAPAYGHLVGVALPGAASEVTVQRTDTVRSILLLVQAAVLVFTLLLAIPQRSVPQRFVPQRFVPQRFVPQRFVPQRFVPQRFVPQRFIPQGRRARALSPRLVPPVRHRARRRGRRLLRRDRDR